MPSVTTENRLSNYLNLRIRPVEREWFQRIAAANGTSVSELIRSAIALEGVRVGVEPPERAS